MRNIIKIIWVFSAKDMAKSEEKEDIAFDISENIVAEMIFVASCIFVPDCLFDDFKFAQKCSPAFCQDVIS